MYRYSHTSDGSARSTVFDWIDGIAVEFKDRLAELVVGLTIVPSPSTYSYDTTVPPSVTSALTGPAPSFRRAPLWADLVGAGRGQ